MTTTIIERKCMGCETCSLRCPDLFNIGENKRARETTGIIPSDRREAFLETASECPTHAIEVY